MNRLKLHGLDAGAPVPDEDAPRMHGRDPGCRVIIPAGRYRVGDDNWPDSFAHEIDLRRPLTVMRGLVTCGDFASFIDCQAYWEERWWIQGSAQPAEGADALYRRLSPYKERFGRPVQATFYEADAFARFSSARLLLEREWEVVADGWLQPKKRHHFEDLRRTITASYPCLSARQLVPEDFSHSGCLFVCAEWCADEYDPFAYRLSRPIVGRGNQAPGRASHKTNASGAIRHRCCRGTEETLVPLSPSWVSRRLSAPETSRMGFRLCWDL
jgi:formylglycine-generating enzyme required for sulfatase activity